MTKCHWLAYPRSLVACTGRRPRKRENPWRSVPRNSLPTSLVVAVGTWLEVKHEFPRYGNVRVHVRRVPLGSKLLRLLLSRAHSDRTWSDMRAPMCLGIDTLHFFSGAALFFLGTASACTPFRACTPPPRQPNAALRPHLAPRDVCAPPTPSHRL